MIMSLLLYLYSFCVTEVLGFDLFIFSAENLFVSCYLLLGILEMIGETILELKFIFWDCFVHC